MKVAKATQPVKELHGTFLRTLLSKSRIPDSHTLLPPSCDVNEKIGESIKDSLSKDELSRRLLCNDPTVSVSIATLIIRESLVFI